MSELKPLPCPHCGEPLKPVTILSKQWHEHPVTGCFNDGIHVYDLAPWNRRAAPDVNLQMLEALKTIADYQFNCCDRDEIEDAQKIARAAIAAAEGKK